MIKEILKYIQDNKEWLFSGLGLTFLSLLALIFQTSFKNFYKSKNNHLNNFSESEIKIIGPRASGKTVYLASLIDWHNLGKRSAIYSIKPQTDETKRLVDLSEDIIRRGFTVAATSYPDGPWNVPEYCINIKILFNPFVWPKYFLLNKHISMNLCLKDYAGEIFERLEDQNKNYLYLKPFLDNWALSSSLLILIDCLTTVEKNDRKYSNIIRNLKEELKVRFLKSGRNFKNYKIAIVFSKCDQIYSLKYKDTPEKFLKKNLPRFYKSLEDFKRDEKCLISYFFCSAFGMKGKPPKPNVKVKTGNYEYEGYVLGDSKCWEPFGLISPVYWLVTGEKLKNL